MPEKTTKLNYHFTGRQLTMTFIAFFVIHAVIIYLANRFFPGNVVLGNHFFSPMMGLLYVTVPFTIIAVGAMPLIAEVAEMMKRKLSNMHWMVAYLIINTAAIWVLARFAEWIGMGISSWMVALGLSVIVTFLQGMVIGMIMNSKK